MTDDLRACEQDQRQLVACRESGVVRDVLGWVAWHAGELAAVGIPLVLAITVSAWLWGLVGLAAGVWASHEYSQLRRQRDLIAESTHSSPAAPVVVEAGDEDVEDSEVRHG